eukprot:TRINITY_DN12231_c0_g1_i1.p1 TRINITY_DN12231_c0_g1~~TRINITY_DN12231_c0_g1_i1.p1  ORF type:complete len:1071 (+),score=237.34 TRINITY_DN12231_c0_g1_i1:405-3215(+)
MTEEDVINLRGEIECDIPHHDLYKFKGKLTLQTDQGTITVSLNEKQLMLRAAQLRNTPYLFGVVVYAGKDTKLSLNQKSPPSKFSTIERRLNRSVIGLFFFTISLCIIATILHYYFMLNDYAGSWYLWDKSPYEEDSASVSSIKIFFSYFAFLSFLIPVSLMVTLEVVKVSQAQFMEWDEQMSAREGQIFPTETSSTILLGEGDGAQTQGGPSHEQKGKEKHAESDPGPKGMSAKTSNLNDELALVKYIFSDKTGTLTENKMAFSKCSVHGIIYNRGFQGELRDELLDPTRKKYDQHELDPLKEFLLTLALCHAVVPAEKEGKIVYQSQSPDEVALADAARQNAFVFLNRNNEGVMIDMLGEQKLFRMLTMMEFSSDRRRMSVVLRNPEGKIIMYSKGSDAVMFPRLIQDQKTPEGMDLIQKTKDDIELFSKDGLRTLVLGMKEIQEDVWREWYERFHRANTSLENREVAVEALCDELEQGFLILGATAVEDKLQDGVPETIDYLLKAGMKVWVITGDKQETAVNIGFSCKLLSEHYPLIIVNAHDSDQCRSILERSLDEHYVGGPDSEIQKEVSLVIDGRTLAFALSDHHRDFLKLASICHSVVCCRVTPLQKALVVRLIKQNTPYITLSIGDGANDVSMIQEAHVGIGLFGKEGTQAARSSDYAVLRFRHLARLITIHGRYSFIRNSGVIKYSFYKNVAFFLVQFWYSFFNAYSAMTLYDDWIITFFNIFITSVPPYFMALFEKDIPEEIIRENPELFRLYQTGYVFTYRSVFLWALNGVFHSLLFFFGIYAFWVFDENTLPGGMVGGRETMGYVASTIGVTVILLKAALSTRWWNICVHIGIWGSIAVYAILSSIDTHFLSQIPNAYGAQENTLRMLSFWCMYLLMVVGVLNFDVSLKYIRRNVAPKDWHILQERYRKHLEPLHPAPHDLTIP